MQNSSKPYLLVLALSAALLIGVVSVRLEAQGTIGSILGTVTDSSGAVIPDAKVQVTNTGTNAIQTTTSDSQGRYRVNALPVGDYDAQSESAGFQIVIRRGIRLSAGADVVVDFSLPVGQVSQTVVVEGSITQVETTSSALGSVVEPLQMRELPLNGRNFEELVLLVPGVNISRGSGTSRNAFTGNSEYWSVSGSRPNGQEILMDGTNVQGYQNRGAGSGILGTSLGVDAIGEFQMLTNTYGAQYGGNGSVMNSVTRSGTNALHGSAYEFTRNAIFDATEWNSSLTEKKPFWKHQYGGTLGGPIKRDKMFFFVNYEGLRQNQSQSNVNTVPNALARIGVIPSTSSLAPCVLDASYGPNMWNCGPTSPNAANFAKVKPYLDQWPLGPNAAGTSIGTGQVVTGYEAPDFSDPTDLGNGTAQLAVSAQSPGSEYYIVGRYDWTISEKDSLFARYLFDDSYQTEPFYGSWPMWPEDEVARNQYITIGQKHVFSDTIVNSLNLAYTRTFFDIHSESLRPTVTPGVLPVGSLNWIGDVLTMIGAPVMDGALSPGSSISSLGPGQSSPIIKMQTKHSISDDLFWIRGAHSLRFGGGLTTNKTDGQHSPGSTGQGTWSFSSLANFLRATPNQFGAGCNFYNVMPACVFPDGSPLPMPNAFRAGRQTEFVMYVQDDWKVRPNLTLNLGLRYAPTTNPYDATHQTYELIPIPFGKNGSESQPPYLGTPPATVLTPMRNFFFTNPSLRTFDPRIGLAWSPFSDGKTSVRAGYGIFHAIMQCRDYCYGSWFSQPWTSTVITNAAQLATFPRPFQVVGTLAQTSRTWGTDPYNTTPYMQQWNIGVQREIMRNTVIQVAYVGSHGVHMHGQRDSNPPLASGERQPYSKLGAISLVSGQTLWPNFPGFNQDMVLTSGTGTFTNNTNPALGPVGTPIITCTAAAGCTIGTADGHAIINPATGKPSYGHIEQTGTGSNAFAVQANQRWNPNFRHMTTGISDLNSHYHALQAGFVRRMTAGLQTQVSYTYASCVDISSGNWSMEGGTRVTDAYRLQDDQGPCVFSTRHNLSVNGVYQLPFTGNKLVEGWQMSGIFYYNHGGYFSINGISNTGNNIGSGAARADYVPNAPGCNGKASNDPFVVDKGVFYTNPACFAVPAPGESGNLGRNSLKGPHHITFNASVQKNTKLSERFSLQLRLEGFNLMNRRNFGNPGGSFTQGGGGSATTRVTGSPNATFGQINGIVGTARQLQLGAKLTF